MTKRNVNGSRFGMVTRRQKRKIISLEARSKAMMCWTFGAIKELGGIMYLIKILIFTWVFPLLQNVGVVH